MVARRFDDMTFKRFLKLLPAIGTIAVGVYYGTVYKVKVDTLETKVAAIELNQTTVLNNTNWLVDKAKSQK